MLLILAFFSALSAVAKTAGTFAAVKGTVTVIHEGRETSAILGGAVLEKDSVRTGPNGAAKIVFPDQSVFDVGAQSELMVEELKSKKNERQSEYFLKYGKIRALVGKRHDRDKFRIRGKNATMGVRGTELGFSDSEFVCFTGECLVFTKDRDEPVEIEGGEVCHIDAQGRVSTEDFDSKAMEKKFQKVTADAARTNHDDKLEKTSASSGEKDAFTKNLEAYESGKNAIEKAVQDDQISSAFTEEELKDFSSLDSAIETALEADDPSEAVERELAESVTEMEYVAPPELIQEDFGVTYTIVGNQNEVSPDAQ